MGSFASLLGGLATGARDAYGEIDKANRDQQFKNNTLVAEAIHNRLTTDDSLLPEEQDHLFNQYLQLHGIKDKKLIEGLRNAAGYHRQALVEHDRKNGYGKQQPELGGGEQVAPETSVGGEDGVPATALPAMPMAPTAGLPQLPAPPEGYQPKTAGQLKFEESRGRTKQAADDKNESNRQAARNATSDLMDDKIAKLQEIDANPNLTKEYKDNAYAILGIKRPTGGAATLRALSAPIYGHELKTMLGEDTLNGEPIKDDVRYTAMTSGGKVVGGHIYTEPTTSKVTIPDANSPTGWSMLQVDRTGQVLGTTTGVPPDPRYAPVVRDGQHQVWVDFGDHKELKSVGNSSTTQRIPSSNPNGPRAQVAPPAPQGQGPSVAPPIPTAPGPVSTASPDARPMPGQPIPRAAGGGGSGRTLASQPKGLPPKTKMDTTVGVNATDHAILPMQRMLDNLDILSNPAVAASISFQADPNTGNITSYLTGHALDGNPRAQQFAADVIAATEDINKIRGAFGATAFRGHDAFQAMIAQAGAGRLLVNPGVLKATLSKSIWDLQAMRDEQASFAGMPLKYNATPSSPLPPPPALGSSTVPAGKIAVIRLSDGKPGTISEGSFDPSKYRKK